ncbi:MAG TPA: ComF family protein [Alphaproteobacteria bacterium]|nr:ComF family protein [Alphaproteobacteria bacterium]
MLSFLFSPLCVNCKKETTLAHTLCEDCWKDLKVDAKEFCLHCSKKTPDLMMDEFQKKCCSKSSLNQQGISLFVYEKTAKDLILKFKHGDALYLSRFFTALFKTLKENNCLKDVDFLTPVPLHWSRHFYRGYNQAVILCQSLKKATGIPWVPILKKASYTKSQGHLSFEARKKNVRNVFKISEKRMEKVKGKTIVLVDDVWTTGATARACIKKLYEAGARKVSVVTLCKVSTKNEGDFNDY